MNGRDPGFDLYVWQAPRDVDAEGAAALVDGWQANGGDPARSPFEPSTDVGWFHRELTGDIPGLDALSDAVPSGSRMPVWLATTDEPPARVVAIRLPDDDPRDALEVILGLATKYDLVLFDPGNRRVHRPLEALAAHATATFWPAGAIQAGVAGVVGAVIAVVAWLLAIPVIGWIAVIIGGFMVLMSVYTFIHEGRAALGRRRS
ncbi:MAG TPA: hypothetical protein VFK35_03375 [Candidatus Limnocylindrales bacterium]|nr:hypothetical protein [Candidatus Limnocylindrales bacterium]